MNPRFAEVRKRHKQWLGEKDTPHGELRLTEVHKLVPPKRTESQGKQLCASHCQGTADTAEWEGYVGRESEQHWQTRSTQQPLSPCLATWVHIICQCS